MKKRYFIFGEEACKIYEENGIDALVDHINDDGDFENYTHYPDADVTIALSAFAGNEHFVELTEEEAEKIAQHPTEVAAISPIKDYDKINHIDLRSDIENNDLNLGDFTREGKVSNSPDTWGIECMKQRTHVGVDYTYLYDDKVEYEQDCKILGI